MEKIRPTTWKYDYLFCTVASWLGRSPFLFFSLAIIWCTELTKLNTLYFERAHLATEKNAGPWSRNKFSQKQNESNYELIRYGSEPSKGCFWGQFHWRRIWIINLEGCEGSQKGPGMQMRHKLLWTRRRSVWCLEVTALDHHQDVQLPIDFWVEMTWSRALHKLQEKKILYNP